jgi:hypothetical protein
MIDPDFGNNVGSRRSSDRAACDVERSNGHGLLSSQ